MDIAVPQKIGEALVLAEHHGKSLRIQSFSNPKTGTPLDYSYFQGARLASVFLPVTTAGEVVILRQFRFAANEFIVEVPGGVPKDGQSPEDAVRSELNEETGFAAGTIIPLPAPRIFFDPASFATPFLPFLVTDCVRVAEPTPDEYEYLEVMTRPLAEWLAMIARGEVKDAKSLAITLLALPYLDVKFHLL